MQRNGVPMNIEEAIKFFKKAIDLGIPISMINYTEMLFNGKGVSVNKEEALKYFKMASADNRDTEKMSFYSYNRIN